MQGTSAISRSSLDKIFAVGRFGEQSSLNIHISDMPRVSVVIPTFNEEKNLRFVLPYIPDWVYEVIIVDGHSTDFTREVACAMRSDIRIIEAQERGKGNALCAGFNAAEGDIIVMMDADGSMNPPEMDLFIWALRSGA